MSPDTAHTPPTATNVANVANVANGDSTAPVAVDHPLLSLPGTTVDPAITLVSGRTLPLDDANTVWAVESGSVEVFAEGRSGRVFLLAVDAGGVLLPTQIQTPPQDKTARLIAVGWSPVRLIRVRLPGPTVPALPPPLSTALAPAVDRWVAAMALSARRPTRADTTAQAVLGPGGVERLEAGARLASRIGVTWAHLDSGLVRLDSGLDLTAGVGDSMAPLTPTLGLTVTAPSVLRGYGTDGLLLVPGWLQRCAAFNHLALTMIAQSMHDADVAEASRMAALRERTEADQTRALGRFATLIDEQGPRSAPPDEVGPLFLACRHVAAAIGHPLNAPVVKRDMPPDSAAEASGLSGVAGIARAGRLRMRQTALRGVWWRQDLGPLVGFRREDGAPVALLPAGRRRYRAVDAEGRETTIANARSAAAIAPMAATLYAPFPDRKLTLFDLLRFGLGRSKADIAVILLMGALAALLGMAVPIATGLVFDSIVPGHEHSRLAQVGAALMAAAAGITAFHVASDLTTLRLEGRIAAALQAAVVDRILRLPARFFATYSSADLAMRALVVEQVRKTLTGVALSSLLAGVFSVFNLALLFHYEPRAALVATGLFALLIGVTAWAGLAQLRAIFEGETLDANLFGLVLDLVNGVSKLRLAGAEDRAFIRWARNFGEMRARMTRSRRIMNRLEAFTAGFDALAMAAIFAVVALIGARTTADPMSAGQFLAFVFAFSSFLGAAHQTSHAVATVFRIVPLVRRAQPILDAEPEVDERKDDPGPLGGGIEVSQVAFRYTPDSPMVLAGISLSIRPGSYIAIVGGSGSGKSTLVRLLLGFEQPEVGGVFYDGRDLRGLDLAAVRRQIGVVLQSSKLMPGSIFESIRGVTDAGESDVWDALRMAGVEEDVRALPMGLHTVLTEGASTLSGGQLQRLMIARALIGKPRLLIFDEATSALDNRTQAIVAASLDRLPVTRIVIAHRLSTVINADRIYVLKRGRVVEQGNHAALIEKNGVFAELVRRQMV